MATRLFEPRAAWLVKLSRFRALPGLVLAVAVAGALAVEPREGEFHGAVQSEVPAWFKSSFLDLREDVKAAAAVNKRLMLYVGQEGCPYCAELMHVNFARKDIVDLTRANFDAIAINLWGDAEVTDLHGNLATEKEFAAGLKVQFTPTLLFFDETGRIVLRLNGYRPPETFLKALEYVAGHEEKNGSFSDFLARHPPDEAAAGELHTEPSFLKPPLKLATRTGAKPLVVFFEQKTCAGCDELHSIVLRDPDTERLLGRFDAVQLDRWADTRLVTPEGKVSNARDWAKALGISYTPSAVLFGTDGREVMRVEGMLKTFHFQSVLDYVASGAWRKEPSFQRYIGERADRIRATGTDVDIWR
jgi:thioredoxin-related protein